MILLDTCILVRLVNHEALPLAVRTRMECEPWAASALSAWEIGIKHATGKLALETPPDRWWPRVMAHYRITELPFTAEQALLAASLPALHADPFDRGIIACALGRGLPVATIDRVFTAYVIPSGLTLIE